MTEYVVGFMFSLSGEKVVLLRKAKPAWMAGKLNGVGGKIEPGETPLQAMVREFREETDVYHTSWTPAGRYCMADALVHIYFTRSMKWTEVKSPTVEPVAAYEVAELDQEVLVPNLGWLIPYLLDFEASGAVGVLARYGGTHTNARRDTACAA